VVQPTNQSLLGFEAQTKKPLRWFWGINHQTRATGFEAQTGKPSSSLVLRLNQETHNRFWVQTRRNRRHQFWGQTRENRRHWFWGQTRENRHYWFWGQTDKNRLSGFEAKPVTNRQPWFWGSTKKPALLISTCTVLTAHYTTPPLDCPATEYPNGATIPGPLHQVSYSCHDPRRCTPCRTCHLHTTRQANVILQTKQRQKKNKLKLSRIRIQSSPSQWLITIKPMNCPLGFSISPLMSPLTTKAQSLKFKSKTPWSIAKRPKKPRKAQEGNLEEGKLQKPANGMKNSKAKQNGKEELRKAQKSKKSSNQSKSSKSTLPLKSTLPNTLNASSPP
jgi:hypothetical protein